MQFGEIIEPSSRALWDCDSDDDINDTTTDFRLKWSDTQHLPKRIKEFIVFEGKIAVDFASNCVAEGKPVASLNGGTFFTNLFYLPDGLVVCTCPGHIEGNGGRITALLEPWIVKAEKIIAVQTLPRTSFLGNLSDEPYILRTLFTSNSKQNCGKLLEQPNMLSGLTAGVLSYCEHIGKAASAWCLYSSLTPYGTDSTSIEPISELLKNLDVPLSRSFRYKPSDSSNLYM